MKIIAVIILVLVVPFARRLLKPENAKRDKATFILFYLIGVAIGLIIMWLLSSIY